VSPDRQKKKKGKLKKPDVADLLQQTYLWHPALTQPTSVVFLHQLNGVSQIFSKLDNPMHSICDKK